MLECALASAPAHKLSSIAWALLAAMLGLFGLDALLFRTHLYTSILEPDSSSGFVELVLWREKTAQQKLGDNLVETLGNSRMGYSPKGVDQRPLHTGYVIRTAGMPGSNPRSWYYVLRDLSLPTSIPPAFLLRIRIHRGKRLFVIDVQKSNTAVALGGKLYDRIADSRGAPPANPWKSQPRHRYRQRVQHLEGQSQILHGCESSVLRLT
jgi:hypothetical protein